MFGSPNQFSRFPDAASRGKASASAARREPRTPGIGRFPATSGRFLQPSRPRARPGPTVKFQLSFTFKRLDRPCAEIPPPTTFQVHDPTGIDLAFAHAEVQANAIADMKDDVSLVGDVVAPQ
jgi:hypothetical protein